MYEVSRILQNVFLHVDVPILPIYCSVQSEMLDRLTLIGTIYYRSLLFSVLNKKKKKYQIIEYEQKNSDNL